ncbi:MAG: FUSC family protein, partial [Gammaproteobacteria bacterium]
MTTLTAGQSKGGSAMSAARRAAAWWSSETVRHALRVALAMVIAFYISLSMGWERPAWAGLAVALCSLSTTGESVNKGLLRILGTLLAGSVVLLLNGLFPQDRWAHLLSATAYIGFCAYMMGHSTRWYVWFIGGYVMALLALAGGPEGAASFEIVILRLQQTTLGVVSYTVVAMLLWPQRRSPVLRQSAGSLMDMHRRLLGHGFAVLRGDPEDPGVTKLRAQASAGAAGLPEVIDGAELDSLDVWDARRLWRRFAGEAAALNEALERWRHGFGELEKLDLGRLMPGMEAFARELDARLASVTGMLDGEAPLTEPEGRAPVLAGDAVSSLNPFDRAAADRAQDLLQQIDRLTRSLHDCAAEIHGIPSGSKPERPAREAAPPWTPDPDRLAYAVRAFATVWIILLACIYVPDLPMPPGVIPVAAALGIQLAVMPQVPVRTLIVPFLMGSAVGGVFYLLVMPHLSSFAGLGAGIFIAVFLVSVLLSKPQQALSRMAALSFFPMIISVSNSQSYNLLFPVNFAIMLQLALMATWITTWFPVSFMPDRVVFKQLKRFFASSDRLARSHGAGMRQA